MAKESEGSKEGRKSNEKAMSAKERIKTLNEMQKSG